MSDIYTDINGDHWIITHDSPSIPMRMFDWVAVHSEYDGPGDCRVLYAETHAELLDSIKAFVVCIDK